MKQTFSIVGDNHCGTTDVVRALKAGEPLRLVREATNRYDPNAVMVWWGSTHIGYIPKKQNAALAKYIDERGELWVDPPALGLALDSTLNARPSMVATFVRSPNSGFPMLDVTL